MPRAGLHRSSGAEQVGLEALGDEAGAVGGEAADVVELAGALAQGELLRSW